MWCCLGPPRPKAAALPASYTLSPRWRAAPLQVQQQQLALKRRSFKQQGSPPRDSPHE